MGPCTGSWFEGVVAEEVSRRPSAILNAPTCSGGQLSAQSIRVKEHSVECVQ
jgi:hypothetical protein